MKQQMAESSMAGTTRSPISFDGVIDSQKAAIISDQYNPIPRMSSNKVTAKSLQKMQKHSATSNVTSRQNSIRGANQQTWGD